MSGPSDLAASIARLANLLARSMTPLFEKADITPQQWAVLSVVASQREPATLASVARTLAVTKQNMTGMASRLEQMGLVERVSNPEDLRSSRIQLTRRGRALMERLHAPYEQWRQAIEAELSEREGSALSAAINRLIERLEQRS